MKKEKEPLVFSPDMDVILQDYVQEGISRSDADTVANRVEKALSWAGFKSPKGYSIGVLRRNYSRNERKHIPTGEPTPESTLPIEYAWSEHMRSVREEYADTIRGLLGNETPDKNYLRRLLDVPELCDRLIYHAQEHDMDVFKRFLAESPYEFWRQQLNRTQNHARHHQAATLGSYIARAFGPDIPPIRTKQWEKWERTMRDILIQSLPIDPDKIAEETLIKLGLAPDDFMTYTLQARRRYTLSIRKKFLTLLSQAQEINRTNQGKTARILEVTLENGEKRLIIFRTVTEANIEEKKDGHRRYHEISATYCSVFENWEEAIRSQTHALEGLEEKISDYEKLLFGFKNFNQFHQSVQNALVTEAFAQCKKRRSFSDNKLVPLLSRFVQDGNNLVLGHIIWTLARGLENTKKKKLEIAQVSQLLKEAQEN